MRRHRSLHAMALPLLAACASAGRAPAEPVSWPPGEYYLEAVITYAAAGGTGRRDELYSADLYIYSDQTLRLDSHFATCLTPSPTDLQNDARRGVRTFSCGDATIEVRPGGDTVIGRLQVLVQEEYAEQVCVRRNATGACAQSITTIRTRPVRKVAQFRVRVTESGV